LQILLGDFIVEVSVFTENVTILGQLLLFDLRKDFFDHKLNVFLRFPLILGRNIVSTEECGDYFDIPLVLFLEIIDDLEKEQFSVEVETVARLHLEGHDTLLNESFDIVFIYSHQLFICGCSASADTRLNPTTFCCNFLV
jgi:hypothetical protein